MDGKAGTSAVGHQVRRQGHRHARDVPLQVGGCGCQSPAVYRRKTFIHSEIATDNSIYGEHLEDPPGVHTLLDARVSGSIYTAGVLSCFHS